MLDNKSWRLNNLYRIVDKNGQSIPFKLNPIQQAVINDSHKRKIILKARQLGMTTCAVLDLLDDVLFNENLAAGIVSYNVEHAQHIFKRIIGHALDTMLPDLKPYLGIVSQSAREISLSNGSYLRVDTSLRGGSYHSILVSEFGKTCARYPAKADEVITGTLQAVGESGKITIESTAEGAAGAFYDMCTRAIERSDEALGPLDYRFLFFPWHTHNEYSLSIETPELKIPPYLKEYFSKLEREEGVTLTEEQKLWYTAQYHNLGDAIQQEYPSTAMESFRGSTDGFFYMSDMNRARTERRITEVPYDSSMPVHTAWDIGYSDPTSIWFFQLLPSGSVHIIDYYENNEEAPAHYVNVLRSKPYVYGNHYLPHDAKAHDRGSGTSMQEQLKSQGVKATILTNYYARKSTFIAEVHRVRMTLSRCYFDELKTEVGVKHLCSYKKKWNAQMEGYTSEAIHDMHSHAADSFRYLCEAIEKPSAGNQKADIDREWSKIQQYRKTRI